MLWRSHIANSALFFSGKISGGLREGWVDEGKWNLRDGILNIALIIWV